MYRCECAGSASTSSSQPLRCDIHASFAASIRLFDMFEKTDPADGCRWSGTTSTIPSVAATDPRCSQPARSPVSGRNRLDRMGPGKARVMHLVEHLVAGRWTTGRDPFTVIDPHDGAPVSTAPSAGPGEVAAAVAAARAAQP